MKRVLSLILAMAMLLCVMPMNVFAAEPILRINYSSSYNEGTYDHNSISGITSGKVVFSGTSLVFDNCKWQINVTSNDRSGISVGNVSTGPNLTFNSSSDISISSTVGGTAIYAFSNDYNSVTIIDSKLKISGTYYVFSSGSFSFTISNSDIEISTVNQAIASNITMDIKGTPTVVLAGTLSDGSNAQPVSVSDLVAKGNYRDSLKYIRIAYQDLPVTGGSSGGNEVYEADPDTDIEIGGKAVNVKYSNKTVIVNDNVLKDVNESNNKYVEVDFSKTAVDIDKILIQNKIVKAINEAGKGVKFQNKYGFAVLDKLDENTNCSIVIGLGKGIASNIQKNAMKTDYVISEVTYNCVSNGEPTNIPAKIYVPCDEKTARVFYIIDDYTIGTLPCKIENGYCVFERYQDGTYVVVE